MTEGLLVGLCARKITSLSVCGGYDLCQPMVNVQTVYSILSSL